MTEKSTEDLKKSIDDMVEESKTWVIYGCKCCGLIWHGKEGKKCDVCGNTTVNTGLTREEWYALPYNEKTKVSEKLVKDSPTFSFEKWNDRLRYHEKCKSVMDNFYKTEIINKYNHPDPPPVENKPKCPTCGSTNVEKIGAGSKVAVAGLFGVFSIGVLGKSFRCKDCSYKW